MGRSPLWYGLKFIQLGDPSALIKCEVSSSLNIGCLTERCLLPIAYSDIEDSSLLYDILKILLLPVSSDYFPASSGSSSFNSSENSTDNMIPLVLSSFYNNPCLKDVQAFYAKESPISSPDPITSPAILTPSSNSLPPKKSESVPHSSSQLRYLIHLRIKLVICAWKHRLPARQVASNPNKEHPISLELPVVINKRENYKEFIIKLSTFLTFMVRTGAVDLFAGFLKEPNHVFSRSRCAEENNSNNLLLVLLNLMIDPCPGWNAYDQLRDRAS
ncbi:hypothetical protein Tco_0648115 [Tanacetum coccineum]